VIATLSNKVCVAGMGEVRVSPDPDDTLSCLGLGSCVALCLHDPVARIGGIAHVVLPECNRPVDDNTCGRFADTAVPWILQQMCSRGAIKSRLVVKLVGGAQMIQADGFEPSIQMGARNIDKVRAALKQQSLRVTAEDVGGHQGRSVWLQVGSGVVTTKCAYGTPRQL